ncbi:MAG: hypothetical protein QM811_04265 [Pirellulales bacterium]
MMRKLSLFAVALVVTIGASDWSSSSSAQEAKAKAKGRLPPYYAKVDVDDKQREAIYKIQASYDPKLDKLEEELKAMREKRDAELRDVLTKAQQKALDEAIEESKSKSKTKKMAEDKAEKAEKAEKTVEKKEKTK